MYKLFNKKTRFEKDAPHVVVVGAGISGLIASVRLVEAGAKVTIIESEPQVGGRVYSKKLGSEYVNLGAQYFFRSDNEYLNYYLKKSKKFMCMNGYHGALWEGTFVSSKDDKFFSELPVDPKMFEDLENAFKEIQADYKLLKQGREFIFDKNPSAFIWKDLDKRSAADYLSSYHEDVVNFFNCFFKPEGGTGADGTSALLLVGWYGAQEGDSGNYLIKGGNQELTESIALDLKKEGVDILLSTKVEGITQKSDSVTVQLNKTKSVEADYVIVTTPAPIAKRIVKDLPKEKVEALDNVMYGASMQVGLHLVDFKPKKKIGSAIFHNESVNAYMNQAKWIKENEAVISINISGEKAHKLSDKELLKHVSKSIKKITPEFNLEKHIKNYMIKKWENGIAVYRPNMQTKYQDMLRANVGRVYFGGDYTHNPALDGAAWSGVRTAESIIDTHNN